MTDAAVTAPKLSPVKQALLKIDALRRELAEARQAAQEPIAVVGIGCRLPGGADSAEALWDMLAAGVDAVGEVPSERWSDALYDPRPGRGDTSYSRHGAFIDGVDRFDAAFFGVSGREARRIDPQQRLLLECTWRAIEEAGFTREGIKAFKTGVFVGSSLDDYARLSEAAEDAEPSPAQTALGTARPFAAGRISYLFGFHGPTVQLDTACSSSLTTTHLACQSLRQRECDVALSGGVNLMLSPEMTIALCELQALSPDGRCKTFDAGANGYVRGEGCGMVALMRLSDARAQGRPIRALILGSAVNHDGKSNGMTAPNGRAQREVIREALVRAGVAPSEVDYVEAHGTGTLLGDPIELRALHEVYCAGAARSQPLLVGSIKTNIGHLEGAASVSALIKVVCALQKAQIPKHLHFETPTPHVDWEHNAIRVTDRHMPWPASRGGRRVAGISSFGMSGTNAHLVVASYDESAENGGVRAPAPIDAVSDAPPAPQLIAFSAHTVPSLRHAITDCAAHVQRHPDLAVADLAHALRAGRDTHRHRCAFVAGTHDELQHGLAAALRSLDAPAASPRAGGKLAFLFTGQGAQYGGMARRLYREFEVVRRVIDECDRHFEPLAEHSLIDVLWGDQQALLDDTRYTQPALFAVESALARLWASWGVVPDLLMGHSVGEYAAACFAGVFSLADGLKLVAARGQLMDSLTPPGKMSAVLASAAELAPYLRAFAGQVELAGDNGPRSVAISGDSAAIDELVRQLERDGLATRALAVSRAFHSPLMEPMLQAFRAVAASVHYEAPRLPVVSNLSARAETTRLAEPDYWVEHVRRAVRSREGMQALCSDGVDTFVEVGPGRVLTGLAKACCAGAAGVSAMRWLHSIDAQHDERASLFAALAGVHGTGRHVDWAGFEASKASPEPHRRIALPPYPLDPASYWVGTRRPADGARRLRVAGAPAASVVRSSLLGHSLSLPASSECRYERSLGLADEPWLGGHRVHERVVFPAAAWLEMALDAARRAAHDRVTLEVHALSLERPLVLDEQHGTSLGTVVRPADAGGSLLAIHSRPQGDEEDAAWSCHCTARIVAGTDSAIEAPALASFRTRCTEALAPDALHERLAEAGLDYRGAFRSIRELWRTRDHALARVELDPGTGGEAHVGVLHPALLDGCLQAVAAALWDAANGAALMPVGMARVRWKAPADVRVLWCAVEVTAHAPLVSADLWFYDAAGDCVAAIERLQLAAVDSGQLAGIWAPDPAVHALEWRPCTLAAPGAATAADCLLVETCGGGIGAALRAELHRAARPCANVAAAADETEDDEQCSARFRQALAAFAPHCGTTRPLIVYAWPSSTDVESLSAADVLAQVAQAHRRFANFWRALHATDWPGTAPAVCIVTQRAQALGGHRPEPQPAQAAAWGLARSLMHESGEARVMVLDVDTDDASAARGALAAIDAALAGGESQFALRDGVLHVPRLVRRTPAAPGCVLAPGAYLVTGGRGAIGTRLVEWLIGKGATKIVSASRQLPSGEEQGRLAAMAGERHAVLQFAAVDLADAQAVDTLVRDIAADRAHPFKGIFHAAGALEDGLLLTQAHASVQKVLSPKVAGTLNLHRATAGFALEHFVSFSSVVSCIGSPGQTAYGAANAYLDALSLQRNAQGLPGHVIDWGVWGGAGMAGQLDSRQRQRIEAVGLGEMAPAAALRTLDRLMSDRQGRSVVWRVDIPRLVQRAGGQGLGPLLCELAPVGEAGAAARPEVRRAAGLGERLRSLPEAERDAALAAHLIDELALTLQVARDAVGLQVPLIELGLDSLMAAELRAAIRNEVGVDVPFGRLLEGATLDDIVRTVVDAMNGGTAPVAAADAPAPRREAKQLDSVSGEAIFGLEMESGQL
ncbi:MAG TPA: type I polyketide synthase [Albitalea sp.]|nr:type I polyketide synthase [Albitalea sp.]